MNDCFVSSAHCAGLGQCSGRTTPRHTPVCVYSLDTNQEEEIWTEITPGFSQFQWEVMQKLPLVSGSFNCKRIEIYLCCCWIGGLPKDAVVELWKEKGGDSSVRKFQSSYVVVWYGMVLIHPCVETAPCIVYRARSSAQLSSAQRHRVFCVAGTRRDGPSWLAGLLHDPGLVSTHDNDCAVC
jgi:hypothetical protein